LEWVEITAKTVEEATQSALEQLGVDEADAQLDVLEEPRPGLFGRMRGEARVRARVAPREQRPKQERRNRRGGGSRSGGDTGAVQGGDGSRPAEVSKPEGDRARASAKPAASSEQQGSTRSRSKEKTVDDVVTVAEQADIMQEFLEGLLAAFAIDGRVERETLDEDTIELGVTGSDLGLLIGLKGQTLVAVQELARTYLQRTATGTYQGRVRIDVGGYRHRRQEALQRFVGEVAEAVRGSGAQRALEPMGPADRKVVHDTVNELAGVRTLSEGQDPRRRVVIIPDGS